MDRSARQGSGTNTGPEKPKDARAIIFDLAKAITTTAR